MMKKLVTAAMAFAVLTGCSLSSDGWDEIKQRAACEKAHPDAPGEAKKCYDDAIVAFGATKTK